MSDYLYSGYSSPIWAPAGTPPPTSGGLRYEVPGMRLITQDKSMSCWFASAQMITEWRIRRNGHSLFGLYSDPSEIERWRKLYTDNVGITNGKILDFARDIGLKAIPPMSPSVRGLQSWLMTYGPLWVNGVQHITVIAGIRDWMGETQVLVFDPARPQSPAGEWRSMSLWYAWDSFSGRDTGAAVRAVFLYAP